jgi:hypothetical protein
MQHNVAVIMPVVLPALIDASQNHWNKQIVAQIHSVLRTFQNMDNNLYDEIALPHKVSQIR